MAAPHLQLLDLDDDMLGLIARLSWLGDPAGGLLGTCRRARAVGTAALHAAGFIWGERGCVPFMPRNGDPLPPLRPAVWEPVVTRFLHRAIGLHDVSLLDRQSRLPFADRAAVWGRLGEVIRAHPLRRMTVQGAGFAAVVARGAAAHPLKELAIAFWSDEETAALCVAALSVVRHSLVVLEVFPSGNQPFLSLLLAAGRMPRLRRANLLSPMVWDAASAAALATTCPLLESLQLKGGALPGVGHAWSWAHGWLPHLSSLAWEHCLDGEAALVWARELGLVLEGRSLQSLCLTDVSTASMDGRVGVGEALLRAAALPAALRLARARLPTPDVVHLLADPRVAADVETLELPSLSLPPSWLPRKGPWPRLRSLSLMLELCDAPDETLAPSAWAGLPALTHLTVALVWKTDVPLDAAGGDPEPVRPQPTVGWVVGSLAASGCRATLRSLRLKGLFFMCPMGVRAFAPLATFPSLRSLTTTVMYGDGLDWRETMPGFCTSNPNGMAALRALLPRVTVWEEG